MLAQNAPGAKAAGRTPRQSLELPQIRVTNRDTAASDVMKQLLHYLGSGAQRPGDRLPSERQLSEAFGVSRSTVREALKALNFLGLVDVRQGAGMFLRANASDVLPQVIEWGLVLGQSRTLDLVEARRYIESIVARLAAERATPKMRDELRERLAAMKRRTDAQDVDGLIEDDIAFHMKIAEIANNSVLTDVLASARSLLHVWVRRVLEANGFTQESYLEHARVFEAIDRGDPKAAEEAMAAHMNSACGHLLATLVHSMGNGDEKNSESS